MHSKNWNRTMTTRTGFEFVVGGAALMLVKKQFRKS